jgi:hypothetical protein
MKVIYIINTNERAIEVRNIDDYYEGIYYIYLLYLFITKVYMYQFELS